jgi:hypothetical protein
MLAVTYPPHQLPQQGENAMKKFIVLTALALAAPAWALDPVCERVLKAYEATVTTQTWTKVISAKGANDVGGEMRKVNGEAYIRMGDKWVKERDIDLFASEFVRQARSGSDVQLSNCKNAGSKVVDGVDTMVISFTVEAKNAPISHNTLLIGKADGLPYVETTSVIQANYRYKNVTVPPVK